MPTPTTMRPTMSVAMFGAKAVTRTPTRNTAAVAIIKVRRPKRSARRPLPSAPRMAPTKTTLVTISSIVAER